MRLFHLTRKIKRALEEAAITAKEGTVIENRLNTFFDIICFPIQGEINRGKYGRALGIDKQ